MSAVVRRQWFLIALAGVLVGGAALHGVLRPWTDAIPRDPLVAIILLAMSAPLDLRRSLAGPKATTAAVIGVAVNTLLAGPLAWVASKGLSEPLAIGLIVVALAPCTLASAAVWTRRGGGNEAVALTVTVVTNLLTFIALPAWAWLLIGQSRSVDAVALSLQMLLYVVLPIAAGQVIRTQPAWRLWCDRRRHALSLFAQIGLLVMVLIGAVRCGALLEHPATRLGPAEWGLLFLLAGGVHCVLFAIGWRLARVAGAPRGEALAAAVAGSQKTLAVGLTVAMDFGSLAILPMIVYHALQLVIDAVLVDRLGVKSANPAHQPS
ncbi:Sodium Bile acid symporter family protein [Botrimarina colliarenosi]|uniref:Sodium Bile acid symporter family protein n=1 Tax=Botrimarina colliarenosi TaxID=2528001 RepID=A0A5C6AQ23_9BACT|nr:bile acid:sodium symporter [Botrimarina colliarenosi]TWU00294.1 Sodium Bile acid symporter family protein [Botrimarina colliarenosi]